MSYSQSEKDSTENRAMVNAGTKFFLAALVFVLVGALAMFFAAFRSEKRDADAGDVITYNFTSEANELFHGKDGRCWHIVFGGAAYSDVSFSRVGGIEVNCDE